jgi:hypothetical protein
MNSFEKDIIEIMNHSSFIYDELFCYFSTLQSIPVYNYKLPKGNSFYRARKNDNFANFQNFNDLYSPPKDLVKNYSRANKPFQSVFYVSDTWETNLAELKPFLLNGLAIGDVIWITQAKLKQLMDFNLVILPDFKNPKMKEFINNFVSKLSENQIQFLSFMNSFFSKPINPTEDDSKTYQLTSAFCNALLAESFRSKNPIDGILYTSVEHGSGFNIALDPSLLEKNKIKIDNVAKHFLRKSSKTTFDNFIEPNMPTNIDFEKSKIDWE